MRRPALILSVNRLVDQLRREGYNVGLEHYLAVQELLLALMARNQLPDRADQLQGVLAPLLCSTPLEQRDFAGHFARWAAAQQVRPPAPVPPAARHKPRRQLWKLAASFALAAALAMVVWAPWNNQDPLATDPSGGTPSGQGGESDVTQPPDPLDPASTDSPDPPDPLHEDEPTALLRRAVELINQRHGEDIPQPVGWEAFYLDHFELLRRSLASLPLAGFFFWLIWRGGSRPLLLERRSTRAAPRLEPLRIRGPSELLFRTSATRRTVQEMRRHRDMGSQDLDVPSTAEASARQAGLFAPVYGRRLLIPEYLVLIDRPSPHDQQARLYEQLIRRLQEGGVFIERYYFDGDPSFCGGRHLSQRYLPLEEIASRHRGHILLLFSDGSGLIDPATDRPNRHLGLLPTWKERVLLTPEHVRHWGSRERSLAEWGFSVLPASRSGLDAFLSSIQSGLPARLRKERWTAPYPELLREWPEQWLEKRPPEAPFLDQLCRDLSFYLDDAAFQWLCACAVYPEMDWHLTLRLGAEIQSGGKPLLDEGRLMALARLPWFRFGAMPDWLRSRLLDEMGEKRQKAVRQALNRILGSSADPSRPGFDLKIAVQDSPLPWWKRLLPKKEPPSSPLRDYVFLSAMLGRKIPRLALAAPDLLRRLLYREGHSLLGIRPLAALAATVLIGLACLVGLPTPGAPPESALPEFVIAQAGSSTAFAQSVETLSEYYRRFLNLCSHYPGSSAAAYCGREGMPLWDGQEDSSSQPARSDSERLYLAYLQEDLAAGDLLEGIELSRSRPLGDNEKPSPQPEDRIFLSLIADDDVPDVALRKVILAQGPIQLGQPLQYQLVVLNSSSRTLAGLALQDELPNGFDLIDSRPSQPVEEQGFLRWALSELAPNQSWETMVTLRPRQLDDGSQSSCAKLLDSDGRVLSEDCAPYSVTDEPQQLASRQIRLEVSRLAPATVAPLQDIALEIRAVNDTASEISGARVELMLDRSLSAVFSDPPGKATPKGVSWDLDGIGAGSESNIDLRIRAQKPGRFRPCLSASGPALVDPSSRCINLSVVDRKPLPQIQVTAREEVRGDDPIQVQIEVRNLASSPVQGVQVQASIPQGLQSADAPSPTVGEQQEIMWELGDLDEGQSRTINLSLRATGAGTYSFCARIASHAERQVTVVVQYPRDCVTIQVSPLTPAVPIIPNLIGLSRDEAQKALAAANLRLGDVRQRDSTRPDGQVLSQSPQGGTEVESGSVVDLIVSNMSRAAAPVSLRITKTGPACAAVGSSVEFVTTLKNVSSATTGQASLSDRLPEGLELSASEPSPTDVQGQQIRWEMATLPGGESRTFRLGAIIKQRGDFEACATVDSTGQNVASTNSPACVTLQAVDPPPQGPWYDHYERALEAIQEKRSWCAAILDLQEAIRKSPQASRRKLKHGVLYIPYFPYLYLGQAYLEIDDRQQARTNLELAKSHGKLTPKLETELKALMSRLESAGSTEQRRQQP